MPKATVLFLPEIVYTEMDDEYGDERDDDHHDSFKPYQDVACLHIWYFNFVSDSLVKL